MSRWKIASRAVPPVLGVGVEPLLIEEATGKAMVVIDYDQKDIHVTPEFEKHPHSLLFALVIGLIPPQHVFSDWFRIVKNAERLALVKRDRDSNG